MKYLKNSSVFDSVNLESINAFLATIVELHDPITDRVEKRYTEKRSNWNSVLSFLLNLGIVEIVKKESKLIIKISPPDSLVISPDLLVQHFKNRIHNFPELLEYLSLFSIDKNGVTLFSGSVSQNIKFASIRNFLISSNILHFDAKSNTYELINEYSSLADLKIIKNHSISKESLEKELVRKKLLGDLAEKLVFEYERNRLRNSPVLVNQIEHVAEINEGAGYDIRSFMINDDDVFIPIRIEVKAVPAKSHKFFWSDNEISQSIEDGDSYYLYLLPVIGKNNPDINSLIVIQNPYRNVFQNNSNWTKKPQSYIIERNPKD